MEEQRVAEGLLEELSDTASGWGWGAVGALAVVVVVVFLLVGLLIWLRRRRPARLPDDALRIDLESLGAADPPEEGPNLECYNVPVRLAVMVLAPIGRTASVPPRDRWPEIADEVIPGLGPALQSHGSLLQPWPAQLSPRGFAHAFFAKVALPGDRGKGSPWCSVAGKCEALGTHWMVGLAMRAAGPNSLSQVVVEHPTRWLDLLRVRSES